MAEKEYAALTYEDTKTIRDMIDKAAAEFTDRAYLRYEYNDLIYDISYEKFAGLCRIVGSYANRMRTELGRTVNIALFGSSSHHYLPVLLGVMGSGTTCENTLSVRLPLVSITPLLFPLVPDVKSIIARSSVDTESSSPSIAHAAPEKRLSRRMSLRLLMPFTD